MHRTLNIAVFGSGRGSNFQAVLSAVEQGKLPDTHIRLVVSNNSSAGILEIARTHGIPAEHISEKRFSGEEEFVEHLLVTLRSQGVNFILLAGYMRRVPARIIREFRNNIINIHPALLPKFGGQGMHGMHVHEAVIAAREEYSGATVHLVDEEYDHGTIIIQKRIRVAQGETPITLAAKVLDIEHEILPEAIKLITEGKIVERDNKVVAT